MRKNAIDRIAIIPARSGSKGLIDKNIRILDGKPLLAYTVEEALKCGLFDKVMVSTDSEMYAEIAMNFGADVPFLRSKETSSDSAPTCDVVLEVLDKYEGAGMSFETFCILQPTSPMRTAQDIVNAYEIFRSKEAFSVVSMTKVEHPLEWCGIIGNDGSLDGFVDRNSCNQRQKYMSFYRPNGAIYMVSVEGYRRDRFLYRERSYAYVMPRERSIDIDSLIDFEIAECLIRNKRMSS